MAIRIFEHSDCARNTCQCWIKSEIIDCDDRMGINEYYYFFGGFSFRLDTAYCMYIRRKLLSFWAQQGVNFWSRSAGGGMELVMCFTPLLWVILWH